MADNLILIGKSGAMAARRALDVTAQNIANANNPEYSRRGVSMNELASAATIGNYASSALAGVTVNRITRSDSPFLASEVRRTGANLARASAELQGLTNAETVVEQSGLFNGIVAFEASLAELAGDPLNASLRAQALQSLGNLAQTFTVADQGLNAAFEELRFNVGNSVNQINLAAEQLALTNDALTRAQAGSGEAAVLFDQRDALLADLSDHADIQAQFDSFGRVTVSIGDAGGTPLVAGNQSTVFASTENPDGSFAFTVGATAATLTGGSLAGTSEAGVSQFNLRTELDQLATNIASTVNAAQAAGVDQDGNPGPPLLTGSSITDIALITSDPRALATASAGAPPNSLDIGNLAAMRATLANNGPADEANSILFNLSSAVQGRSINRDALGAIAAGAEIALTSQTGVDLDQEAADLVRYQQAFQASGRVIQVASEIFDTVLSLR